MNDIYKEYTEKFYQLVNIIQQHGFTADEANMMLEEFESSVKLCLSLKGGGPISKEMCSGSKTEEGGTVNGNSE